MTNKEQIILLLDKVPDYKMGYVLAYVQGMVADEETDDLFCEQLAERYLNSEDKDKDEGITLEAYAKQRGIPLNR